MKLLFLDFDGVLNSLDNMEANYFLWKNNPEAHKSKDRFGDLFDQRCVNWLAYIIMKTNCKIVISSSWRKSGELFLHELWEERNMPGVIVGQTPELDDRIRGEEIAAWRLFTSFPVTHYCILDDNTDMLDDQLLVKTNPRFGLTKDEAIQVIAILNK